MFYSEKRTIFFMLFLCLTSCLTRHNLSEPIGEPAVHLHDETIGQFITVFTYKLSHVHRQFRVSYQNWRTLRPGPGPWTFCALMVQTTDIMRQSGRNFLFSLFLSLMSFIFDLC